MCRKVPSSGGCLSEQKKPNSACPPGCTGLRMTGNVFSLPKQQLENTKRREPGFTIHTG